MDVSGSLLDRTRRITGLLQSQGPGRVTCSDLVHVLTQTLGGPVALISDQSKVIAASVGTKLKVGAVLDDGSTHALMGCAEATVLRGVRMAGRLHGEPVHLATDRALILPVFGGGQRLGTLVVGKELDEAGLVLAELAGVIVGLKLLHDHQEGARVQSHRAMAARMAVSALSYSEAAAVAHAFQALGGSDGLLVAAHVAHRTGFTRSTLVKALRKLESAGVIATHSLGKKGTYIQVLNPNVLDQVARLSA